MKNGIDLVLHPGHEKCGSTTIQVDVYKRRAELEEQGVFIPDARFRVGSEPEPRSADRTYSGQFYPIWYLEDLMCGRLGLSHFERRLDEALGHAADQGCRRLLITSENLSNLVREHASELHRLIASRFQTSKVLYYMRRQDDWILSSWQQWHHKVGLTLEAWVDRCLERGIPNFLAAADAFEGIYGEGRLDLVPLHGSAFVGGGLLPDFYSRAGIETGEGPPDAPISNQAVNPYLCDILARIPSVFETRHHDAEVASRLARHVSSSDLLFRRHGEFMGDAMRSRILDHFARDNRELHRRYFASLDFDAVFARPPAASEESRMTSEIESIKEVLAIQMDLLLKLMKSSEAQARADALRVA